MKETSSPTPDTPRTSQRQALAEAISTAMSKGLERLLAAKESKKTYKVPGNERRQC